MYMYLFWWNALNFFGTLIDIVLLNKPVLEDFICMWYKKAKPSNTFYPPIKSGGYGDRHGVRLSVRL